jgi:hypothetical protein
MIRKKTLASVTYHGTHESDGIFDMTSKRECIGRRIIPLSSSYSIPFCCSPGELVDDIELQTESFEVEESTASGNGMNSKIKYRCKLCGQLKQNHRCPFQSGLHRSIGVMVYCAVNAYTANEPGRLAAPLNEMNNLMFYDQDASSQSQTIIDIAASPSETSKNNNSPVGIFATTVTPEQRIQSHDVTESCNPSFSTSINEKGQSCSQLFLPLDSNQPSPCTNGTTSHSVNKVRPLCNIRCELVDATSAGAKRSRAHFEIDEIHSGKSHALLRNKEAPTTATQFGNATTSTNAPRLNSYLDILSVYRKNFEESTVLRPEQYRSVETDDKVVHTECYDYPPVPLPKSERKRLCDTLFYMVSQEIPDMQEECAQVLQEAKSSTSVEWDLAVAELLTQITVGLYCCEGDVKLDGLAKYLMSLGISC